MDEFQYNIDPAEALRKSIRRRILIGVVMLVMLPLLPVVIYFIQFYVSDFIITLVFIVFGIVGFSGLILVGYYGWGSSSVIKNYEMFVKMGHPAPKIVDKTAILNRDPVYLVGQWGSNTIFFIAFRHSERSFESKLKLPRVVWRWEYDLEIGDLKVARREGRFTIPVDEGLYLSGDGILYSLIAEQGTGRVRFRIDFSAEQLEMIVKYLQEDIERGTSVN